MKLHFRSIDGEREKRGNFSSSDSYWPVRNLLARKKHSILNAHYKFIMPCAEQEQEKEMN